VLSGLRAAFNIPHELRSNWIFQVTECGERAPYYSATRKWLGVYGILPLGLFALAVNLLYWPLLEALFRTGFQITISIVLIYVLFYEFAKVPFTCTYYPGKKNAAILAGVYLYGFSAFTASMRGLENWLALSPLRSELFFIVAIATASAMSKRPASGPKRLVYEERSDADVLTLGLD
jgi:hypothetical protein